MGEEEERGGREKRVEKRESKRKKIRKKKRENNIYTNNWIF